VWKDRLAFILFGLIYLAAVIAIVHAQGFHPLGQGSEGGIIAFLFR
jgi:hypothetical protein